MHPHHPLPRSAVIQHVWSLHDPARSQVAGGLEGQKLVDECPGYEIGRGIAVDRLEGAAIKMVLAN